MGLVNAFGDLGLEATQQDMLAKQEALRALAAPLTYTATTVTLTANQIAGTDPIIAANANRKALKFRAVYNFEIAGASGQALGMRVFASARDGMSGADCPMGAVYLATGAGTTAASQFAAGDKILVWEA